MADDKSNVGGQDRSRVSAEQGYELDYFAQKHGISREQARDLIERIGNDREKLDAAAERLGSRRNHSSVPTTSVRLISSLRSPCSRVARAISPTTSAASSMKASPEAIMAEGPLMSASSTLRSLRSSC